MFQEGTDQALNDQLQRPTLRPVASPNFWAGSLSALPRGIGAGTAEGIAFGAELAGAFGDVMAGTGTQSAGGMFSTQTEKERRESEASRQRTLNGQTAYSNEAGDLFRQRARDLMPDPQTTGTGANLLAGIARFGTKAVAYTLGGNPFGAGALGLDEALTESDRLKLAGVDLRTRSQAGAVAGVVAAGSMMAPMSGSSALVRFGKGAAVGEASMIAQSAAEKAILEHAGYDKIGSTFDPFDPVALAVGLVPGAIGARFGHAPTKAPAAGMNPLGSMGLAERQALAYNDTRLDAYAVAAAQREGVPPEALLALKNAGEKSGPTATSPAGARGVMQFMPETWKRYGQGDIADPVNSIDAGARYLKDLLQQYDGDTRAALAHYNGGSKAGRAVHEGGVAPAPETQAYLARTDAYLAERGGAEAGRAAASDPEAQAAARLNQVADAMESSRLTPEEDMAGRAAHQDALELAHDQMAAGEPVNVAEMVRLPEDTVPTRMELGQGYAVTLPKGGEQITLTRVKGSGDAVSAPGHATSAEEGNQAIVARDAQGNEVGRLDFSRGSKAIESEVAAAWRRKGIGTLLYDAAERHGADFSGDPLKLGTVSADALALRRFRDQRLQKAQAPRRTGAAVDQLHAARNQDFERVYPTEVAADKPKPAATPPAKDAAAGAPQASVTPAGPSQAKVDMQAAEVLRLHPEMLVHLEGMDAPERVGDLMERVRQEAVQESKEAQLLQVAASCFLRST
jgi:hypothetical protein